MSEIAISLKNVSKCHKRYVHPVDRLKEILLPGKSRAEEFWALRDINLEIQKGQTLGIVGRNGSGKSTMLQIIAKTLIQTTGEVHVNGRISALLELGSGFNPEFTGQQNVFFNGRLLGLSQKEIEDKFDEIAGFADIGDFIDQPVKTYSSGMFVRLAFAVAVSVNPDIFIVDEALAVGDLGFQRRCYRKIESIRKLGKTVLLVSHDLSSIKRYSDAVLLLHEGSVHALGNSNDVIHEYIKLIDSDESKNKIDASHEISSFTIQKVKNSEIRYGNGNATIENFAILDLNGSICDFIQSGNSYVLEWHIHFHEAVEEPCTGIYLKTLNGFDLFSTNTYYEKISLASQKKGSVLIVRFTLSMPLAPGNYVLGFGLSDMSRNKITPLDRRYDALCFRVVGRPTGIGVLAMRPVIEITSLSYSEQLSANATS